MSEEKALVDRLVDPLPAALWAVAGGILTHLWRRYRARMISLRWQAIHQPIAISAQDAFFGTIEVSYNGSPVQNLFFSTLDVQNQSNSDLVNVDLNIVFQDGTCIYMAHGAMQGSANALPFAAPFAGDLNRFLRLQSTDPSRSVLGDALSKRRDFRVPVLNRGAGLRIGMLVQAQPGRQPVVNLGCDYPGVRLLFQGPQNLLFGVEQNLAAFTGLLLGVAVVMAITAATISPTYSAFAAFFVGCFTAVLGAGLVRTFRWFGRLLG